MRLPFIVALSKGSRVIKVVSYTQELQGKGTVHSKLKSTCLTSAVQCCLFLLMFGFPELEILVVEMFASLLNILQLNSTCSTLPKIHLKNSAAIPLRNHDLVSQTKKSTTPVLLKEECGLLPLQLNQLGHH